MQTQVFRSSRQLAIVGAAASTLVLVGATAPAGAGVHMPIQRHMHMHTAPSAPEHVAEALAALGRGETDTARKELQRAVASNTEPKSARGHAREALNALTVGDPAMARVHAENGAAVEHLTYALRALGARKPIAARGHLREALGIARVHAEAKAAIAALKNGDRAQARHHILAGLKQASTD